MPLMVTPLYAALLALWFVVLTVRVIRSRRNGIYIGDGGDPALLRIIRGHANFAEFVPLALLLMLLLELSHFSIYVLHAIGITLLVARLLHGYALSFTEHFKFGRMAGMTLTLIVLLVEVLLCLYQAFQGHYLWCCAG